MKVLIHSGLAGHLTSFLNSEFSLFVKVIASVKISELVFFLRMFCW